MRRMKRSLEFGWRRPRDATVGDESRGADLHALKILLVRWRSKGISRGLKLQIVNSSVDGKAAGQQAVVFISG